MTDLDPITVTITKVGDKGTIEDHPVFEGYTIKAVILPDHLPEVGKPYQVMRIERNDESKLGVFTTSMVEEVGGRTLKDGQPIGPLHFSTRNSTYRIDFP